MTRCRILVSWAILLAGGCLYNARERADQAACELAAHPFDLLPLQKAEPKPTPSAAAVEHPPLPEKDLQTTSLLQPAEPAQNVKKSQPQYNLTIPSVIPGSEAPPIVLSENAAAREKEIQRLYPPLPPLAVEPIPQPGPNGQPYTLSSLQHLAAIHSPQVRQFAADVQAARGNLMQAKAYPNPTVAYQAQPSNDGSTAGLQGFSVDQPIKTGGKLALAAAAAEVDLQNAELALKRARSDLATQVRNAYFGVLVAQETIRVTRGLARFTDEIYRLQAQGLVGSGTAAAYEPVALRAQAYTARLAHQQAIQTYQYAWIQLVTALGLRHLPLSEVAGRVDALIPNFDFDAVRFYALQNHTDVLIAQNGIQKAKYNLKLAQATLIPDVDVNVGLLKEFSLPPKQFVHTLTIGVPLRIWDQNKGNIYAAESALHRAAEEPHRVEENLTNTLATAYQGYKNSLIALEYYRRHILPDQVRAYRGVLERRQVDKDAQFGDLVAAQQALVTGVSSYLAVLGQLWTSVVSVADVLQTDDLFQLGKPETLPPLPDLDKLLPWPCCHECPPVGAEKGKRCDSCAPSPTVSQPRQAKE